jgi:hypothetical protein
MIATDRGIAFVPNRIDVEAHAPAMVLKESFAFETAKAGI